MKNQEPVLVLVRDLFFRAKIVATAEALASSIRILASPETLIEACRRQPDSLVILDLSDGSSDPIGLIRSLKEDQATPRPRILGFYSHVNKELEREAREAGCDLVLPKSTFSRRLPEILTGALSTD